MQRISPYLACILSYNGVLHGFESPPLYLHRGVGEIVGARDRPLRSFLPGFPFYDLDHRRPFIMATPLAFGVGAITAALVGRQLLRRAGQGAAEQWVKGGFKAKMDRKEAIAILGLKCVAVILCSIPLDS